MKSINVLLGACCVAALFAVSACRKIDWGHVPPSLGRGCDYVKAYSTAVSEDHSVTYPLFTKTYDPGTFKPTHLQVRYRNIAGYSITDNAEYEVSYPPSRIVLDGGTGKAASFGFDAGGKLKTGSMTFDGSTIQFRFYYASGKLSEVKYSFGSDWE